MPSTLSASKHRYRLAFEAIGTRWHIDTPLQLPIDIVGRIFTIIQAFDSKWSRFRADSQVTALRQTPGALALDTDEYAMWQLYQAAYDATDGAVSPLVGETLDAAGYDAEYSLARTSTPSAAPAWRDTLTLAPDSLALHAPALLDIGSAGKGLLVDRVAAVLGGVHSYTIDAGGDMFVRGHTERVALEHPHDPSQAIGMTRVADAALCGSAPNRRAWADTHHIVDARSGRATQDVASTWALAPSAMLADMATTALFFLPPREVQQLIDCHTVVMTADSQVHYTHSQDIEIYA